MKNIIKLLFLTIITLRGETKDIPDLFGPKEENHILRITARVLTEDGQPLENADVHVAIENFNDFKDGSNDIRGKTGTDGKFSAEGVGRPQATIIATHEGFYPSRKQYRNWDNIDEARKSGKYTPWNPSIDLTLKKINKPIPMIVRFGTESWIHTTPVPGDEVGFDLFEFDWVQPHGKGKIPDLLITLKLQSEDKENSVVKGAIRFGNKEDGLIPFLDPSAPESLLLYPTTAPKDGYDLRVVRPFYPIQVSRDQAAVKEPVGYLFRIRTQRDKSTGKIVSAFYGKIVADAGHTENINPFVVYPYSWKDNERQYVPRIKFNYYLNPINNDQNIEFDQINNLVPDAIKGSVYPP